jgi:hypothetical protein
MNELNEPTLSPAMPARAAGILSRIQPTPGRLLAAGITAFVILKLLASYYSPQVRIPMFGSNIRESFQIYQFDNGYTEENSEYYAAYIDHDPRGHQTWELAFAAHDRFRLDFLGDGRIHFPGALTTITRSGLRQVTTNYRFEQKSLATHDLRLDAEDAFNYVAEDDPYIDMTLSGLPVESVSTAYSVVPVLYVLGPILLVFFLYKIRRYLVEYRFTVAVVLCAFLFLTFVDLTLPYNHGPDEESHVYSGEWYLTHLAPPSMAYPVFYNGWGWNYVLGNPDLTYWLTFKLTHLIQAFQPLPLYKAARLGQLGALFGLFLLVLRFTQPQVVWAFVLSAVLVPQVAYTMTYVNGDVLSYFLSIAALGILLAPRDLDSRIAIPISFFVLCNTKQNYLVLLPVALYFLYREYGFKYWPYVVGGLAIGSYRRVFTLVDEHLVGRTFLQNALLHCKPRVRDRLLGGHLEWDILFRPDFYKTSFKSLYALLGYLNFFFPWYFYVAGAVLAVLLFRANERRHRILIGGVFLVNLGMSLYFSMSMEYQPQGRYLFPTLVLLFLLSVTRIPVKRYLWFAIPTVLAVAHFWLTFLHDAR